MKNLDRHYTVETGLYDKEAWYEILRGFQDANLYQAISYDMARYGRRGVAHLILKMNGTVVAASQARVVRLPGIRTGIAYVRCGPLWRPAGKPDETEIFRQALRALRNEFSFRKGFVLRLFPFAYRSTDNVLDRILLEEGYEVHEEGKTERTLVVDLGPSIEEMRSALDQKWRNCLNRAEKNGLELVSGEEDELFAEFEKAYREMVTRKGLAELSDIIHLRKVQEDLPADLKLKVVLCRRNGDLCAGAVFAAIGTMGVYLCGATTDVGLKTNGSYAVQWEFVKWLKENRFRYYDLNGINPETNPGTYRFKRGLAGKFSSDVELLGKFQTAESRLSLWAVKSGEWLVSKYRRLNKRRKSLQRAQASG